ncbi:MAG: hypothetical protein NC393_07220 [Clostridium sp.]|nr:hypothetical protein [Clostridium sp.]MCM1171902.1 hypothetical protein [Clostridium sp.]MCM1209112.1 hypothetical protein [Ruminococcus sp.]
MFRVINEYMSKVHLRSDKEIYDKLNTYLSSYEDIAYFTVTVNHNVYVVDIKVDNYTLALAEKLFGDFNKNISYPYSALYLRFNEGKCVRYRYITSQENKDAFYCDIIIS